MYSRQGRFDLRVDQNHIGQLEIKGVLTDIIIGNRGVKYGFRATFMMNKRKSIGSPKCSRTPGNRFAGVSGPSRGGPAIYICSKAMPAASDTRKLVRICVPPLPAARRAAEPLYPISTSAARNPGKICRPPSGILVHSASCINIHLSCIIYTSLNTMEAQS